MGGQCEVGAPRDDNDRTRMEEADSVSQGWVSSTLHGFAHLNTTTFHGRSCCPHFTHDSRALGEVPGCGWQGGDSAERLCGPTFQCGETPQGAFHRAEEQRQGLSRPLRQGTAGPRERRGSPGRRGRLCQKTMLVKRWGTVWSLAREATQKDRERVHVA